MSYPKVYLPDHPLSYSNGNVFVHRMILFDALGPADQPCHWCGEVLPWVADSWEKALCVDHLDNDSTNNDLTNLVPACRSCNTQRTKGTRWRTHCGNGHLLAVDLYVTPKGLRQCRGCKRDYKARQRA